MEKFIPKPYKSGNISIYLGKEKQETIERLAAKYKISRNKFIIQCIDYAIANMPDREDPV